MNFGQLKFKNDLIYSMNEKIWNIQSTLNIGNNIIRDNGRWLGRKLEFPNVIWPIFVVFTDCNQFIRVGKVNLVANDPVSRIMKDLIV
jgi:hypothetical protein